MSGVIYEDMIKPWLRISLSEVAASRVMKLTVLLMGTVCVTLVYLVEKLSGLIQVGIGGSTRVALSIVFRLASTRGYIAFSFRCQAARSLSAITAGPLLGVFTLGMFFPLANSAVRQTSKRFLRSLNVPPLIESTTSQGALVGGFVSLNLVAWISFGTQAAISSGKIRFPTKPVSIDGCPESLKSQATNFTLVVETAIK